MFEQLNKQLIEVKEKLREQRKLQGSLAKAQQSLSQESDRLVYLGSELQKEGADVEKLDGLSLTGLFYTILGSKDEQLDKERQEYLAAKLKYDECSDSVSAIEREVVELKGQIAQLGDLDSQYKAILDTKEKLISESSDENAERLIGLSEELADAQADMKELKEAINAGSEVLNGLRSVISSLKSAGNWGTWDILGGGMFATAIKHSKIDDAKASAHRVQQSLRRFQRELADLGSRTDITIEIGSFATFADYFFDGLIADWVVQSKIERSFENANNVRPRVQNTVTSLQRKLKEVQNKADSLKERRRTLIEEA